MLTDHDEARHYRTARSWCQPQDPHTARMNVTYLYTSRGTDKELRRVVGEGRGNRRANERRGARQDEDLAQSCLLSSAWVRLSTNAPLKFAGGSMILTGFRAGLLLGTASDGKGRSGRDVGNEWARAAGARVWADAASGEDTRGRDAAGLNGEGATRAVMTAV